jgi:hypothetical protein
LPQFEVVPDEKENAPKGSSSDQNLRLLSPREICPGVGERENEGHSEAKEQIDTVSEVWDTP